MYNLTTQNPGVLECSVCYRCLVYPTRFVIDVWSIQHGIRDATHCDTLQHTATHCNTLQHTAPHCNTLQHTATHCNTLHYTAAHCTTLHYTATHCNTLQHDIRNATDTNAKTQNLNRSSLERVVYFCVCLADTACTLACSNTMLLVSSPTQYL